jgi:transcriptional regulator with XRE-family HTH domain
MTLFERIKKISKDRGFALTEVARRAEIGEKSIYAWKPSKAYPDGITPRRETLEKVADVLHVSVDYLLGNTDNPSPAPAADKIPAWATSADVAEWIDFIKEDQANNLNYKGIELTEEEKQQLIGAMSSVFWKHMKREKDRGGNA